MIGIGILKKPLKKRMIRIGILKKTLKKRMIASDLGFLIARNGLYVTTVQPSPTANLSVDVVHAVSDLIHLPDS